MHGARKDATKTTHPELTSRLLATLLQRTPMTFMGSSATGSPTDAPRTGAALDPERWVDEHGDCLYRYALVRVRKPEVAQDLVQETLLAALRGAEKFGGR